jgi:hypothetical protein
MSTLGDTLETTEFYDYPPRGSEHSLKKCTLADAAAILSQVYGADFIYARMYGEWHAFKKNHAPFGSFDEPTFDHYIL